MSHEGTSGMVAEAVATEVQAIVQALASEPNTPADDAQISSEAGEPEGTVVAALEEAVVAEVDQAVLVSDAAAETQFRMDAAANDCTAAPATKAVVAEAEAPDSGTRKEADVSETTAAAEVEARTAEAKEGVSKARVKVRNAKKAVASTNPAKSKPRNTKRVKQVAAPEAVAKKTAAAAAKKVVKTRAKSSKAKLHITAVAKPKAPASKSTAAHKTAGTKPQALKPAAPSAHKAESQSFTVPEVWRSIVKKNERQGRALYDVLVCHHAVPANDNTYRRARACPECRLAVQKYADEAAASRGRHVRGRRRA